MATCDSPPPCESEEPGPASDEGDKETSEPDCDTVVDEVVEPKGYSKRDKRLEKLRQLRLRSVSLLNIMICHSLDGSFCDYSKCH